MLNNYKDKGRKGRHFSQQKGKIRKNSRVDISIKQHMGIAGTDTGKTVNVDIPLPNSLKISNISQILKEE